MVSGLRWPRQSLSVANGRGATIAKAAELAGAAMLDQRTCRRDALPRKPRAEARDALEPTLRLSSSQTCGGRSGGRADARSRSPPKIG